MSKKIHEKAMLVDLTCRSWGGRKVDYSISREVIEKAKAKAGVGTFNKCLLPQGALTELKAIQTAARKYHRSTTLPWDDGGARILGVSDYQKYCEEMDGHIEKMLSARRKLMSEYASLIAQAKTDLGTLFNAEDYPEEAALEQSFEMSYEVKPIPSEQHILFDLGKAETRRIQNQITADVNAKLKDANRDLYQRMSDAVNRVSERLTPTADGETKIFCRSMIDQLREMLNTVPRLNLTDDPELSKLCEKVREELASVEPEELRPNSPKFDPKRRVEVKASADNLGDQIAAAKARV